MARVEPFLPVAFTQPCTEPVAIMAAEATDMLLVEIWQPDTGIFMTKLFSVRQTLVEGANSTSQHEAVALWRN